VPGFSSVVWPVWIFPNRLWQRINQTMQMLNSNARTCLIIALASTLVLNAAEADGPLVDIQSVNPTIMVDLRYAGANNLVKHPLYPQGMRALARSEVASALTAAQMFLHRYQYGLKIWDAYRPVAVQTQLWEASHNSDYVANPGIGVGSLHSWGIAVDATLVDSWNRPVSMPSDFDDFTPAAMLRYTGPSNEILGHLRLLQYAMHRAGFWGMRTEWWHFTIADWRKYLPEEAQHSAHVCETRWNGRL
jgi:D-alanyl-D-alanine dipeptidase